MPEQISAIRSASFAPSPSRSGPRGSASEDFIARFLRRVPGEVAATFTPEQLAAVQGAFGLRYTMDHAVDVRRTVRLPWGGFYFVLLAGRDARGGGRRWFGSATVAALATACVAVFALVAV